MSTDAKVTIENLRNNRGAYTREQKLVATVWYHERLYTGMSYNQLAINFKLRFNAKSPNRNVLRKWDEKLFRDGFFFRVPGERPSTYLPRLVHIPYVRESFIRFPDLAEKYRADLLGINATSLRSILRKDLDKEEIELWKQQGRKQAASNNSDKKPLDDKGSSLKEDISEENDDTEIEVEGVEEDFTVEFVSDEDEGNIETKVLHEEIFIKSEH